MNDQSTLTSRGESSLWKREALPGDLLLRMHELMLTGRLLEERLIRMQRQGDGYFWIGGPGEEAFNTALGLLVKKGQGLDYDYMHLHYRSSATMLALGADPVDSLRQMANSALDPYSGGRNFVGHYSIPEWNVVPITSPIEVQYPIAIGTGLAQRRPGCTGITVVQGGDAGTAEGDFASALVWAARPGCELPMLIIVANNHWGISTSAGTQHGEKRISDRGIPFGIKTATVNGNDAEEAYRALSYAIDYVRRNRKPFLLEAYVSRLYGHSSSSGSNFVDSEADCVREIERLLVERELRTEEDCEALRRRIYEELLEGAKQAVAEPKPRPETIWDYVFADRNYVGERVQKNANERGNG